MHVRALIDELTSNSQTKTLFMSNQAMGINVPKFSN